MTLGVISYRITPSAQSPLLPPKATGLSPRGNHDLTFRQGSMTGVKA